MSLLLAAIGLLGLAVGSFLNVVIARVPAGRSVVRPGSACPDCGHEIRARHNVPVLSWLWLRGRCADCRTPISVRYPLVELLTAGLFVAVTAALISSDRLPLAPAFLYFTALGVALAMIDLDVHRLPNALVLPSYPVLAGLLAFGAWQLGEPVLLLRAAIGAGAMFLGYLWAIGRMSDIRLVFEYHGAEHKAIAAYERGDQLTPEAWSSEPARRSCSAPCSASRCSPRSAAIAVLPCPSVPSW